MEKTNEEAAFLLEGFAGGDTLAGELLKQVGDLGHSIWKSVAAEAGNHMALANALDRFANTIERVTDSVLSDGQPVDAEKIEAARMQASDLRVAAEKMRSVAAGIQPKAAIKEPCSGSRLSSPPCATGTCKPVTEE